MAIIYRDSLFNMSIGDHDNGAAIGQAGRAALVAMALCLIGLFVVAGALEPDPRGMGTHRQLGLPSCTFVTIFSKPCPGCGMTTSFAHFVRGEFAQSGRANPAGLLLAVVFATAVPWCLVSAVRGRLLLVDNPAPFVAVLLGATGSVAILVWFWRLWFGV
jgi:hypothetical protein